MVTSQLFTEAFDSEWFILGVLEEPMEYSTAYFCKENQHDL